MDSNSTDDDEFDSSPQDNSYKRKLSENTLSEDEIPTSHYPEYSPMASNIAPVFGKKQKLDFPNYSSASMRMMEKMGFRGDQGLGSMGQGRLEPVQASMQKGRRGLGMRLDDLETAASTWDPAMETLKIPESIEWLDNYNDDFPDRDTLCQWTLCGEKKEVMEDETLFCDPNILYKILESKSLFDNLGADDMRRARTKSNPFEKIRSNIFQNRAAVKMANMDSMFDFMFTNPRDDNNQPLVREDQLLYFADVCAGPGGFSEYILWKKKWQAKGFGFTLKDSNDFKLDEFYAGPPETFDPYYGINEDGNVYDPENIESFTNYVLRQTESGVHFMMADGGFSVEGSENEQEILSKQLYLCQCLVALSIVRENGHFVVKLFDVFTRFSVGLIYLLFKCFKKICICKPNTSRPANSERYLVCKWKKPNTDTIKRHLFDINQKLWKKSHSSSAEEYVLELVPTDLMQEDDDFFKYIYDSNNDLGRNQIIGLLKIAAFSKDSTLLEKRQDEVRMQCLSLWKLPDKIRRAPIKKSLDQMWSDMLLEWMKEKDFMKAPDIVLQGTLKLDHCFPSIFGWYFVALDTVEDESTKKVRTFFMGRGGKDVQVYNSKSGTWNASAHRIELPVDSLIYGEIVRELQGEGKKQTAIYALHIIDAICLGGIDIRKKSLTERNRMCQKFSRALNKPYRSACIADNSGNSSHHMESTAAAPIPIRCKRLFELSELDRFFDRLNSYQLKDNKTRLGFTLKNDLEQDRFFIPHGLLFLNEVRSDYLKQFSKTQRRHYYFEKATKQSFYPEQILDKTKVIASFKNSFINRSLWGWEMEDQIYSNEECDANDIEKIDRLLYRQDLNLFIYQKFNS